MLTKLAPDSRFRVEHGEERLRVYHRWYQKGMWMLVPFCLMGIGVYAATAPDAFRKGSFFGPALAGLILAGLSYLMLAALVNRTELIVTHATLHLQDGPLPWPHGSRVLPTPQIVQVFVEQYKARDTEKHQIRRYALSVKMRGGTTERLFSGHEHTHELLTIGEELVHWLGLEDLPVGVDADRERKK